MDWRELEPTEKQLIAIHNMARAIEWPSTPPKTRGECCEYINKLKTEIQTRLSLTGQFRPKDSFDDFSDEGSYEGYSHPLEGENIF